MFKKYYFNLRVFLLSVLSVLVLNVSANHDTTTVGKVEMALHEEADKVVAAIHSTTESAHNAEVAAAHAEGEFKPTDLILHHIADAHEWHFMDIGHSSVILPLPIILYSSANGLDVFLSSDFAGSHHGPKEYKGYVLNHEKITFKDSSKGSLYDFSLTKNVASTLIAVALMLLTFLSVRKLYASNHGKAPSGIQSFMEPIIVYISEVIVIPNLGVKNGKKFAPYLLTLFFFILFNNLMGLLPGGANSSGNIAFTCSLALITFVITNVNGNKSYWGHIFAPPGVPIPLYIIMLPVEIIGLLTKPFSLTVRLFANITAGHIIILSLFSFIFIFKSEFVGVGSSLFVIFMTFLEILVAFVQPFIFTMLSALYIGAAVEEHAHHDEAHH
jgi:F-type H+-transporting ATPase subunit a